LYRSTRKTISLSTLSKVVQIGSSPRLMPPRFETIKSSPIIRR